MSLLTLLFLIDVIIFSPTSPPRQQHQHQPPHNAQHHQQNQQQHQKHQPQQQQPQKPDIKPKKRLNREKIVSKIENVQLLEEGPKGKIER